MKKIKRLMIILIILALIIISIILYRYFNNKIENEQVKNTDLSTEIPDEDPYNDTFSSIKDRNDYFTIKQIIEEYYWNIREVNGDIKEEENKFEDIKNTKEEMKKEAINSIKNQMDELYKNDCGISDETIIKEANRYILKDTEIKTNTQYEIHIEDMKVAKISESQLLFLTVVDVNKIKTNMLIKLDLDNNLFSIFLADYIQKYKYNEKMSKEDIKIDNSRINETDNNHFVYNTITDAEIAKEYFEMYKWYFFNNSQRAYNLLQNDYKEKRFGDYQEFQEYVGEMQDRYSSLSLTKYKVDTEDYENIYFKILDNYNNCFIIKINEDNFFEYRIQLDDYTIENEDFNKIYKDATDNKKVYANIAKFFKMLNTKDYKAAYNVLNNTFRTSNFATLEEFKKYAKQNFFDYTEVVRSEDISKNGTYYTCKLIIKEGNKAYANEMEKDFIVSLKEGTDFEMSFNVN